MLLRLTVVLSLAACHDARKPSPYVAYGLEPSRDHESLIADAIRTTNETLGTNAVRLQEGGGFSDEPGGAVPVLLVRNGGLGPMPFG